MLFEKEKEQFGLKIPLLAFLVLGFAFDASARRAPRDEDEYLEKPYEVKPFRLVAKVGSPDLIGFEVEGIIPGIHDWLGIYSGFTYLPIGGGSSSTDGVETQKTSGGLDHIGVGTNLYVTGDAHGLFLALGYDRTSAYNDVSGTDPYSTKKSWVNPTQMLSTQIGYKYVGRIFTYAFIGGYGFNFGYKKPDTGPDDSALFNKGDWILVGFSFGVAFPVHR